MTKYNDTSLFGDIVDEILDEDDLDEDDLDEDCDYNEDDWDGYEDVDFFDEV